MAGIDDLYQNLLGRQGDAEGLTYWNQQLASGTSFEDVTAAFKNSAEFVERQRSIEGTAAQPTSVLGKDISGLRWDDLAQDLNTDKVRRNDSVNNGIDMYSGEGRSSYLGRDAQGYVDQTQANKNWQGGRDGGVDAYDWRSITAINFKDENGPEGMMTSLYRNDDGSVGVRYYQENDDFLTEMVKFAALSFALYTGVGMLGEALGGAAAAGIPEGAALTSGGGGTIGTAASGVGEMSFTEFASEMGLQAADTVGNLQSSLANLGGGLQPVGTTGFQATGSLGFSAAGATPGALGSLAPGAFAAETIGGLAALTPGALLPSTGHLGSLAPGYFGAETLGGLSPLVPKVMQPDLSHLGSLGEGYFAGEGLNPLGPEGNWWDKFVPSPGTLADVAKDVAVGVIGGAIVDKVVNGGGTPGGGGSPGSISINIPKPEPSASALQPSASQRAGVKFGRTRSKRQLKGMFSGTGLSL